MKKTLTIILLSLCFTAFSQSNNFQGRILDSKNFPLPGAIIKIESEDLYTTSDFNGYFLIQNLKEGSYIISICTVLKNEAKHKQFYDQYFDIFSAFTTLTSTFNSMSSEIFFSYPILL